MYICLFIVYKIITYFKCEYEQYLTIICEFKNKQKKSIYT